MREVVSLVFGIREAKLTIAKDEGGKVNFFLYIYPNQLTKYISDQKKNSPNIQPWPVGIVT